MGLLRNLIESSNNIVARVVNTQLMTWILAVSDVLEGANPAMSQASWFIDPIGGNDINSGLTATTALKTDAERQRRMGDYPIWTLSEYHIRYLNDLPATDPVAIIGECANSATNIYLHGSATNGQGKAILATLTATAVTALNQAGNQPLLFTAAGIVTSWTADGLLNNRVRMTSGAGLGGVVWPALDLGAKQASMTETVLSAASTFTNPYTFPSTAFVPLVNDTFVVESLTGINLYVSLTGSSSLFPVANAVILDSLLLNGYTHTGACTVSMWGCIWGSTSAPGFIKQVQLSGTRIKASGIVMAESVNLAASYFDDSAAGTPIVRMNNGLSTFNRMMTVQRNGIRVTNPTAAGGGSLTFNMIGGFCILNNSAGPGMEIIGQVDFNSTETIWGTCGAGGTPFLFGAPGSKLVYTAALPGAASYYTVSVAAAPGAAWASIRGDSASVRTNAPAFNLAANVYFSPNRNLTPALLQATLAGGGFNGQFNDATTGCIMAGG